MLTIFKDIFRSKMLHLFFLSILPLLSCSEIDEFEEIFTNDTLQYEVYSSDGAIGQSAALYGDDLFIIKDKLASITIFDMINKSSQTLKLQANNSLTPYGNVQFHCNQSCFGIDKYDQTDKYPLLYISQRQDSTYRCVTTVYRIVEKEKKDNSRYDIELVQEILFPALTKENSLGNVNVIVDTINKKLYTYSRNTNKGDLNYGICRISVFNIPDIYQEHIELSDNDILYSYSIDCLADNMQGGSINQYKLYIAQGMKSAGYINLRVIDLKTQKLEKTYNLLNQGIDWEPEGCFIYEKHLYLTSNSNTNIYEFLDVLDI